MMTLDRIVWRFVDGIIFLAIVGMVALILLQVGSRSAGVSVAWTEELSRFLFIWTVWLGLAAGFRNNQHPAIDLLPALLPEQFKIAARITKACAVIILFSVVAWFGWTLFRQQVLFGEQSAILQVGMWVTTLPIIIGSVLAVLGVLVSAVTGRAIEDDIVIRSKKQEETGS